MISTMIKKKVEYEFHSLSGILYKKYYGIISLFDIFSSWEDAFNKNKIPAKTKGFILDYRKASFNIQEDHYVKIAEFYQKHIRIFSNLKIAIVTKNPEDIVIPILFMEKDKGYSSMPFTTIEGAKEWILS